MVGLMHAALGAMTSGLGLLFVCSCAILCVPPHCRLILDKFHVGCDAIPIFRSLAKHNSRVFGAVSALEWTRPPCRVAFKYQIDTLISFVAGVTRCFWWSLASCTLSYLPAGAPHLSHPQPYMPVACRQLPLPLISRRQHYF